MPADTTVSERVHPGAGFISFRSKLKLSANDLRRITFGLEASYGVFVALDLLARLDEDPTDPRRGMTNYFDVRLRSYLTQGWKYDLVAERRDYTRFFWETAFGIEFEREAVTFLELLRETSYVWVPESELRVRTIIVRSPGVFSFEGLGDAIREVRQLIKDIWYRNRQEKLQGEMMLEATRQALEHFPAAAKVRASGMADKANLLLTGGMQELFDLESEGKLEPLGTSLDAEDDERR